MAQISFRKFRVKLIFQKDSAIYNSLRSKVRCTRQHRLSSIEREVLDTAEDKLQIYRSQWITNLCNFIFYVLWANMIGTPQNLILWIIDIVFEMRWLGILVRYRVRYVFHFRVGYASSCMCYLAVRESYTITSSRFHDSIDNLPSMRSPGNWLTRSIVAKTFCYLLQCQSSSNRYPSSQKHIFTVWYGWRLLKNWRLENHQRYFPVPRPT